MGLVFVVCVGFEAVAVVFSIRRKRTGSGSFCLRSILMKKLKFWPQKTINFNARIMACF